MSKKLAIALSLLTILCLSLAGQALAQTGLPGVKAGDSFKYSISAYWSSTNTSLTVPEFLVQNNSTKWFNVSVSYVSGANVSSTDTWEYKNGTTGASRVDMEVENGTLNFYIPGLPAFQGFFPADLTTGDLLYPQNSGGPRINQTISKQYASGSRDTNVVSSSFEVIDNTNSSVGTETLTYYIDKPTGVLVERTDVTVFPDQQGSVNWTLTDTNVWNVSSPSTILPDTTTIIVIVVIVVVVVAVAAFYLRGRKHGRRR